MGRIPHTVTINNGGDSETAPRHVYLAYHIQAKPNEVTGNVGAPAGAKVTKQFESIAEMTADYTYRR